MVQRAILDAVGVAPVDPQYVQGSMPDEVWAHFRSGAVVQTTRDRSRHYPGLVGTAPGTLGLYLRVSELRVAASHVIDAGCGSGEGLRHLGLAYRRTSGIDKDPTALAFARELAPHAHLIGADLVYGSLRAEPAQLACMVDVLGHVERPERALLNLERRLTGQSALFVAEPMAAADQCLVPPARRAFSMRGLIAVLARGGFTVEQWLSCQPPFLICHAVSHRDPAAVTLLNAELHLERGALQTAEELAQHACRSRVPALSIEALLALARIQMELNRRDAATATLLEAQELDPRDPRPPAALSRLARLAGAESRAIALAREATRLELTEIAAVTALADLLHQTDPRAALDSWLVAHALAPDHTGIAARLCEAALEVGDCALAVTVLERHRCFSPKGQTANDSIAMGWLLAHEGHALRAKLQARLAEALEPNSPDLKELRDFLRTLPTK